MPHPPKVVVKPSIRTIFNTKAKFAITRVLTAVDPDDWDQRPEYICKGCGYHVNTCMCKKAAPRARYTPTGNACQVSHII